MSIQGGPVEGTASFYVCPQNGIVGSRYIDFQEEVDTSEDYVRITVSQSLPYGTFPSRITYVGEAEIEW